MADQVRQYALGELMSDEDSLMHYGVLGMKWGKSRAKASAYDIRDAGDRLKVGQNALQRQRQTIRKTKGKENKKAEKAKYQEMKTEFLKNPDRVIATRLTRGDKIVAGVLGGPVGLAVIATSSAVSRRIEQKQDTGAYDK